MKGFGLIFIIMTQLLSKNTSASSISDTIPLPNKVILSQAQALGTIKDLISYDGLKEIQKIQESQMADLREILKQKDVIISSYEATNQRNQQIISNKDAIITIKDSQYKDLEKKYRISVRWGRFKVVLIPVAVAGGAYLGYKFLK